MQPGVSMLIAIEIIVGVILITEGVSKLRGCNHNQVKRVKLKNGSNKTYYKITCEECGFEWEEKATRGRPKKI